MRNVRFFSPILICALFLNLPVQASVNDLLTWRNAAGLAGALVSFYFMSKLVEKPKAENAEEKPFQLQAPENKPDSQEKKGNSKPWIDHDHPFLKPEVFLPIFFGAIIMHYFFGNHIYRIINDNLFR